MSLDNVFMGKKVVQQIYLKNALIYQSKGWETLPSAPQVLWTKNFGSVENYPWDCAVDQENNIYIVYSNRIYKISSEGVLIWKKQMSGLYKICIDQNNNIYLAQVSAFELNDSSYSAIINQIDSNGNVLNRIKVHGYLTNVITGFTFDRDYLYISSIYNPDGKNIMLYRVDKDLKNSVNLGYNGTTSMDNIVTSLDCPYIYYGTDTMYQIKKEGITVSKPTKIKDLLSIKNIIIDNLGNVIFSNESYTYKYNIASQQITEMPIVSNYVSKSICLDYQKNLYSLNLHVSNSPFTANLVKTSSDGTSIYNTQIVVNDSYLGLDDSMLIADNNGNIYYAYQNDNKELLITKIINLIKKGN